MSKNLQIAAETLQGAFGSRSDSELTPFGRAVLLLAEIYLAKQPANDKELVTEKMNDRAKCSWNPLGLKLGERVLVRRTCTVEYTDERKKELVFLDQQRPMLVVGIRRKAIGTYPSGHLIRFDSEYCGPYLRVDKWLWLYECRKTMRSRPVLVHPDDIDLEFNKDVV